MTTSAKPTSWKLTATAKVQQGRIEIGLFDPHGVPLPGEFRGICLDMDDAEKAICQLQKAVDMLKEGKSQ